MKTVAIITDQCPEELNKILSEADSKGKGEIMRKLWKHDVEDHFAFKKDQTRNGMYEELTCVVIV